MATNLYLHEILLHLLKKEYRCFLDGGFFTYQVRGEKILTDLISKLRDKKIFSSTEQVIADYILNNYKDLANFSTRRLAKETFTSSAAIVRFSQKLGCSGYAEFKTKFLT